MSAPPVSSSKTPEWPERALHELLGAIVESSIDALVSKSTKGIILTWNPAAEKLFGYRRDEAIGRHISLIIPFDRLYEEDVIMARLLCGERISRFETQRRHRDGHLIPVELTISPIKDESGQVVGASKVARDLTALREAQARERLFREASEEYSARFRAIFEQSPSLGAILALDGSILDINRCASVDWGGSHDRLVGTCFVDAPWWVNSGEEGSVIREAVAAAAAGEPFRAMRKAQRPNGEIRTLDLSIVPIRDEHHGVIQLTAMGVDVTDRERSAAEQQELEGELRHATAELEQSNERKDEFIATLAHELRNPLGAVRTSISVLKSPGLAPRAIAETHAIMERQVGQITRLLDDLLDVSRITRGHLALRLDAVDLRQVVDDAVAVAEPVFAAAGVTLHTRLSSTPLRARADATRVRQMIDNILNNAAKYTPQGGSATLSVQADGSDLVVTVSDTGVGIDPGALHRVFEMFVTVRNDANRSEGGLGIGLCLVKRLAAMHGGDVTVHSDGLGRGTTFELRLPVLVPGAVTQPPTPASAGGDAAAASASDGRRVLIIDDDADNAEALSTLLQLHGCRTVVATDGPTAIACAHEFRPAIVLLDLGLADMDGFEVCRRLKALPGQQPIVAALTGRGQAKDRRRAQHAGFDCHFVKPADPGAILKLVNSRTSG